MSSFQPRIYYCCVFWNATEVYLNEWKLGLGHVSIYFINLLVHIHKYKIKLSAGVIKNTHSIKYIYDYVLVLKINHKCILGTQASPYLRRNRDDIKSMRINNLILITASQFKTNIVCVLYKNSTTFLEIEFNVCTSIERSKPGDAKYTCNLQTCDLKFYLIIIQTNSKINATLSLHTHTSYVFLCNDK